MQTSMCCSASAFATMMLLLVGLFIASNNLNYRGQQAAAQLVPMPKISMAVKEGPWPKCVGMSGDECASYIEENTKGLTIVIIPEGSIVTEDFRTDRVRVFVDADGTVFSIPSRG